MGLFLFFLLCWPGKLNHTDLADGDEHAAPDTEHCGLIVFQEDANFIDNWGKVNMAASLSVSYLLLCSLTPAAYLNYRLSGCPETAALHLPLVTVSSLTTTCFIVWLGAGAPGSGGHCFACPPSTQGHSVCSFGISMD